MGPHGLVSNEFSISVLGAAFEGIGIHKDGRLGALNPKSLEKIPPEMSDNDKLVEYKKLTDERKNKEKKSNITASIINDLNYYSTPLSRFLPDAVHRFAQGPGQYTGKLKNLSESTGIGESYFKNFSNFAGSVIESLNLLRRIIKAPLSNKDRVSRAIHTSERRKTIINMIRERKLDSFNEINLDKISDNDIIIRLQTYKIYLENKYSSRSFTESELMRINSILYHINLYTPDNVLDEEQKSLIQDLIDNINNKTIAFSDLQKILTLNFDNLPDQVKQELLTLQKIIQEPLDLLKIHDYEACFSLKEAKTNESLSNALLIISTALKCVGLGIAYVNVPLGLTIWSCGYIFELICSIPSYRYYGCKLLGKFPIKGINNINSDNLKALLVEEILTIIQSNNIKHTSAINAEVIDIFKNTYSELFPKEINTNKQDSNQLTLKYSDKIKLFDVILKKIKEHNLNSMAIIHELNEKNIENKPQSYKEQQRRNLWNSDFMYGLRIKGTVTFLKTLLDTTPAFSELSTQNTELKDLAKYTVYYQTKEYIKSLGIPTTDLDLLLEGKREMAKLEKDCIEKKRLFDEYHVVHTNLKEDIRITTKEYQDSYIKLSKLKNKDSEIGSESLSKEIKNSFIQTTHLCEKLKEYTEKSNDMQKGYEVRKKAYIDANNNLEQLKSVCNIIEYNFFKTLSSVLDGGRTVSISYPTPPFTQ